MVDQQSHTASGPRQFLWLLVLLGGVLVALFHGSFRHEQVLFANDGPLGANAAEYGRMPSGFKGFWCDLNWVGYHLGNASPNITFLLLTLLGPVFFAKFYTPISLLLLGCAAWLFGRRTGFPPGVCLLIGLAAGLNSLCFSYASWGLGTLPLSIAGVFLALAALSSRSAPVWCRTALAGLAVGLSIMEGFDNGAIFSLYIAAFALLQVLLERGGVPASWLQGLLRVGLIALLAAWLSASALSSLFSTALRSPAGTAQDLMSPEQKWEFATDWSYPPKETLRFLIPGLFGYRMDTEGGGAYWGTVGSSRRWEEYLASDRRGPPPTDDSRLRFSGAGPYAGLLVLIGALWAVTQAFRGRQSPFDSRERAFVGLWGALAVLSLLLALGRYSVFYSLVYSLPYFSNIRIPLKFLHALNICLVILFGYGLLALWRSAAAGTMSGDSLTNRLRSWWTKAPGFERRWACGLLGAIAASLVGWMIYAASGQEHLRHLSLVRFPDDLARQIHRFSLKEVGWYVALLSLSSAAWLAVVSRLFRPHVGKWAFLGLGLVLILDLGRANQHWVVYWNYPQKYATNPVLDILREKPWEHRVTGLFLRMPPDLMAAQEDLQSVYQLDWTQHKFLYYNIQSLDVVQSPRESADNVAFKTALQQQPLRLWQLTGTRYFLMMAAVLPAVNEQLDPALKRFRLHTAFALTQTTANGPVGVQTNTAGPYALVQFDGALPRAQLYTRWQVLTNNAAVLRELTAPTFDPSQTVLVSGALPNPDASSAARGTVSYEAYSPKHLRLRATATTASVLLLNDKYHPAWSVRVDGQPAPLLRCNHIMRGVYLQPGDHTIEFHFAPPLPALWISLAALIAGIALLGFLAIQSRRASPEAMAEAPAAKPRPA